MLKKILALVVVLAAAAAADEGALSGPCRDARLVGPGERGGRAIDKYEQCQIAKSDACGNHYAKTYFCATSPASRFCFAALCLAWLAMLFVLLGSTADDYFSPALEQLSEDAGLPPRFAGVTLLALGNGAPDVSSNVHLVASDAVGERAGLDTALGALTGAGMFVTTCVAGMVMVIADGAKAKGALLRDVTAYGAASAVVWGVLAGGRVTRAGAATLLALYVLFVLVVLAADLYHRRPGGPYDLARRSGATEPDDAVEMMLTLIHDVRQRRRRPQVGSSADEEKTSTPTGARNPFWARARVPPGRRGGGARATGRPRRRTTTTGPTRRPRARSSSRATTSRRCGRRCWRRPRRPPRRRPWRASSPSTSWRGPGRTCSRRWRTRSRRRS